MFVARHYMVIWIKKYIILSIYDKNKIIFFFIFKYIKFEKILKKKLFLGKLGIEDNKATHVNKFTIIPKSTFKNLNV